MRAVTGSMVNQDGTIVVRIKHYTRRYNLKILQFTEFRQFICEVYILCVAIRILLCNLGTLIIVNEIRKRNVLIVESNEKNVKIE